MKEKKERTSRPFSPGDKGRKGVFVTGTDTGVGKTAVACALVRALESDGLRCAVFKPVESGCDTRDGVPTPADATRLARACRRQPPLDAVCRYRFADAVSPARAAQLAGVKLHVGDLVAACRNDGANVTVVEGAGGLLSPIASDGVNADLAVALGFAVIVVAADKLGCINHVLLTLEAAAARGLALIAVALNRDVTAVRDAALDNAGELSTLTPAPIVEIAGRWSNDDDGARDAAGIGHLAQRVRRAIRV